MSNYPNIAKLAIDAAVYIPAELDGETNCEAIRVRGSDEENMYGTGEESGLEYTVNFEDVDLKNDMFYEFVLMENGA